MYEEKKKNNILLQGTILAAASVIVRLIGLIYRIPMTRILGNEAMGYYSYAYEFYNLALLLSSYSLPLAVSKLVSASETKGEHKTSKRIFAMALLFGLIVGSIATGVCFFGAEIYGKIIKLEGVIIPLKVLSPTIFVFSVMGVLRGYFQGHNNMVPTAVSQILEQIVNAVVSVGASWLLLRKYENHEMRYSYGAAGGTLGTLAGAVTALLSLIIMYLVYRKAFRIIEQDTILEDESEIGNFGILKMIFFTVLPVVMSQTVYQCSGMIDSSVFSMIMENKGIEETVRASHYGIYANKYKLLTNLPVAIASALGTAIVPGLIAEYVRNRFDSVREKVASAVKFNMIIAIPCAFGMSVFAEPILYMLFGDTNALSIKMLQFGSISIVAFALSTLTNGILQGINHLHIPVLHSAIALGIHVVVLVIMLRTDLWSYALVVCNVLFALVVCILNWISIGKYLNYRQEIKTTFIVPTEASVIMSFDAFLVYKLLKGLLGMKLACIIAILVAVPVYFAFLIILKGIQEEELRRMPKGAVLVRIMKKCRLLK